MNYEEFKENFKKDLKSVLADRGMDVNVKENRTEKMNESYDAVSVTPEGSNIGVNANLEAIYGAYEDGEAYSDVVYRAADSVEKGLDSTPEIDINSLLDYSQMKDKLSTEVVSAERNAELLKKVPHKSLEDMAVIYRLVLDKDNSGNGTIVVTNDLMNQFGITQEQLHADAMANSPVIRPSEIKGMSEALFEMTGKELVPKVEPEDETMFVATVPDKIHGAGVISYPNFMEDAAEKLGGNFYLLPSSIHEVLLVRDNGTFNSKQLEDMVKDVNATRVNPEDRLTDHAYHYDAKEHVFELASKYEERMAEKAEEEHEGGKESLLDDLKTKKEKTVKETPEKKSKDAVKKNRGGEAL